MELSAAVLSRAGDHAPLVEGVRGHRYHRPQLHARLPDKMAAAIYYSPARPTHRRWCPRPASVLARRGTKPVEPIRAGTPGHTRRARQSSAQKLLAPAQAVILETDPVTARAAAREYVKTYVPRLPNYQNNLVELGYTDADFANGCSDRLVDDIVAWGDVATIKSRIQAHYEAGADHVCILPLATTGRLPNMTTVEALAP